MKKFIVLALIISIACSMILSGCSSKSPDKGVLTDSGSTNSIEDSSVPETASNTGIKEETENLSLSERIFRIDDWVYYAENDKVYRTKGILYFGEEVFAANIGQLRPPGIRHLTKCGDYLLFTHAAYIYKMNIYTLETEVLVESENELTCFDYAINDKTIYFVGIDGDGDYQDGIYRIGINDVDPQMITTGVRGSFWGIQIYKNKIYVSVQNIGLFSVSFDGSNEQKIPDVLENKIGDFLIYGNHILWRTDGKLYVSDIGGNYRIPISNYCTGYIVKDGRIIYSETATNASGIFMSDIDGKNQKTIFNGIASVEGSLDNAVYIRKDGIYLLHYINILSEKPPTEIPLDSSFDFETARVSSKVEFTEALANSDVKVISIISDIHLSDISAGYTLYAKMNTSTLIIEENVVFKISSYNFFVQDCNIVVNGKLEIAGKILTYGEIEFSGDGEIDTGSNGVIVCLIQYNPNATAINRLLSIDSFYTEVHILDLMKSSYSLDEDIEISSGKTLNVGGFGSDFTLIVPQNITLTNHGNLQLNSPPRIEGNYRGGGAVTIRGTPYEIN